MVDITQANPSNNKDPYSLDINDGVGQGREQEISPTAPDDELNKDADKIDYLSDTDHSMMLTEENIQQLFQEELIEDNSDHEFRGDFQSAKQDLEVAIEEIAFLSKYRRKILAVGISSKDIYAIESRYPGLLVQVGNGFTMESNSSNSHYAIEALSDTIGKIISNAKTAIFKFIDWVSATANKTFENMKKHALEARIKRLQERLNSGRKFITPAELLNQLENRVNVWQEAFAVTGFADALGIELKLSDFTGVKDPKDYRAWIRVVESKNPNLKGTTADNNAIVKYGTELKRFAKELKVLKLDETAISYIKTADQTLINIAAMNPFDPEKSATIEELYIRGLKDTDSYGSHTIKVITESLEELKKKLNQVKSTPEDEEVAVKEYLDVFNDIGQNISELLRDFKRNDRIVNLTYTFIDFVTWSCDSTNGYVARYGKEAQRA